MEGLGQVRRRIAGLAFLAAGLGALMISQSGEGEELVAYEIVDQFSIPTPLTTTPGDPARGREIAINRRQGNCLACHGMPIEEQPFHGEVGPPLYGVANRYDAGELRLRIVDSKVVNSETMMPSFYRAEGFHRVTSQFADKPILTAQEVEDVVAYLMTLTEDL